MLNDVHLRYQPVIHVDGTIAVHEAIVDDLGTIKTASYEPVRIEGVDIGDLTILVEKIQSHIELYKPITEDDLDAIIYGQEFLEPSIDTDDESEDKVVDLLDYFARGM